MSNLLEHIRTRGVDVRLAGGRLQVRGAVTDSVRELVRQNRAELIALLTPHLGHALSPELQAHRWGPSLGHDLPGIEIKAVDPRATAEALKAADQADDYARAERVAIGCGDC